MQRDSVLHLKRKIMGKLECRHWVGSNLGLVFHGRRFFENGKTGQCIA